MRSLTRLCNDCLVNNAENSDLVEVMSKLISHLGDACAKLRAAGGQNIILQAGEVRFEVAYREEPEPARQAYGSGIGFRGSDEVDPGDVDQGVVRGRNEVAISRDRLAELEEKARRYEALTT